MKNYDVRVGIDMITAKQARETAKQITENRAAQQMELIKKEIEKSINKGEFDCSIKMTEKLFETNKTKLEELGYKISGWNQLTEEFTKISWEDET